jgi:hypothetical protein
MQTLPEVNRKITKLLNVNGSRTVVFLENRNNDFVVTRDGVVVKA